jgi:hypothetical protein
MKLLHGKRFLRALALFALLLFSGDLVADAVSDMSLGHCDSEPSQSAPCNDKAPCPHCSCATHAGAVVLADFAMNVSRDLQPGNLLPGDDEGTPLRLAASIDHPPQLA